MNNVRELTFRVVVLSIVLTVMLAMSNAYLALKIGMLTSASIPAAILSMGILRFFKNSSLLENNLVQTAASAGEAVAGGIVYTIPALIMIHYWFGFSYWENFGFAFLGGILGVFFSIPLRRFLVTDKHLPFPEAAAIAEVLKMSGEGGSFRCMIQGGAVGAFIELCQTGFKVIASQWQLWWASGNTLIGLGVGFSPTLIGAGYLIGFDTALSIFIGAMLSWVIGVPVISQFFPELVHHAAHASEAAGYLWSSQIRYIAIGTMLTAGIGTIFSLARPFIRNLRDSVQEWQEKSLTGNRILSPPESDIPWHWNVLGMTLAGIALMLFFWHVFPLKLFHLDHAGTISVLLTALVYVFIIGFIFSIITGYFSGLVGVSASPGSAVIIAGMLLIGFILASLLSFLTPDVWTEHQTMAAEAMAIMIGAIFTGIACIANDNIQDLKVGHLLNASPWKQQVMLLLGVLVAALVIPPVMQILFEVYGIGDVLPRTGMDPTQALPAPPATMMAGLTQAVFSHHLPWNYLLIGFGIAIVFFITRWLNRNSFAKNLSVPGIGIGMYLPLSSSIPLFIGGLIFKACRKKNQPANQKSILLACGLLAGSALMDVLLAIPFALASSPNVLNLVESGKYWNILTVLFGISVWILCGFWFKRLNVEKNK